MALSILLKLSSEIGSDARSTFTFFSGDVGREKASYAYFIEHANILVNGGKLNLYTVDQLFTFFQKELSQKNPDLREGQRLYINGYYASLDAVSKASQDSLVGLEEDERLKVLRTILFYQLCQIPASVENIQFGLYCLKSAENKKIEGYLRDLVKMGALFLRPQSKTYELAASTGEDPIMLIDRYIEDASLHPQNTVEAFLDEAGGNRRSDFAEAKAYNLHFGEDKRFKTCFIRAKDLGDKLWKELYTEYEDKKDKPAQSYEGVLVYALCEDDAEVKVAREAVKSIPYTNFAVAVPHDPQPFTENLLRVKACRHYLPPNDSLKISAQIESRLRDILSNPEDGYLPSLERVFRTIEEGGAACWYKRDGKVLVDRPKQSHKPADMLCEELFKKRCRIKHPDLNLCHDDKWRTGRNTALRQAIGVLLNAERVMIDKGNPDNHGEKRYLEKVLLKGAGALKKTGSEGPVVFFECETDPGKIHDDYPILKELHNRLAGLKPEEMFVLGSFLIEAQEAPYGVGGTSLILALAQAIRAYGERLIVYKDSTRMEEQVLRSYDDLVNIVADPATKTVFTVRDISPEQLNLIDVVATVIGAAPLKHGEIRSLNSVFDLLKQWWVNLLPVAKIISLYENDKQKHLNNFKELMDSITGNVDRFAFLLELLPPLYTGDSLKESLTEQDAEVITKSFADDVKTFNFGGNIAYAQISQAICEVFGTKGDIVECEKVVSKWYKNLNPNQRDPERCNTEEASQLLVRLAEHSPDFKIKIGNLLPRDYGFGPVSDWTSLHIKDYVAKIKHAKAEIDKAKPVVPKPAIKEQVYELNENQKMNVDIPTGASQLVYTLDGSDPRISEDSQKADGKLDLVKLLQGRPNIKLQMRAIDKDGNYSDAVKIELVSKERKYQLQTVSDIFGEYEATFKCPKDAEGFVAVLKSVINYGLEKKLLSKDYAKKIESILSDMIKGK